MSTPVLLVALDHGPLIWSTIQTLPPTRAGVLVAADVRRAADRVGRHRVARATIQTTAAAAAAATEALCPRTADALDPTRRPDLTVIPWFVMRLSEQRLGQQQRVLRAVARRTVVRLPKSVPGILIRRRRPRRIWKSRSNPVHLRPV